MMTFGRLFGGGSAAEAGSLEDAFYAESEGVLITPGNPCGGAANLKGAAAPPAAGPFNSTLHTGDPILGLNVVLLYFITYALHWWHVVSSCVVVNLFLALRALCLAC